VSLLEQQNVLAKLFTEPDFRDRFFREAAASGAMSGLAESETNELVQLVSQEVGVFADSLIRKRFREVEKLLPLTSREMGDRFRPEFFDFAAAFNPVGLRKHYEDAVQFSLHLESSSLYSEAIVDSTRFERVRLQFFNEGRRISFCRRPKAVADALGQTFRPRPERRARIGFAVWLRFRERTYHFDF